MYERDCKFEHKVSFSTFYKIWKVFLNHIKIQTPKTDVCKTCRLLTREIVEKRQHLSLDEHQELANKLSNHLELVKNERLVYQNYINSATTYVDQIDRNLPKIPNTFDIEMHYSFDYAQ